MNKLFYGDNLEILRRDIGSETIDLCYIDPPFNSKRTYNQIYNNVGKEDKAQARAFIDTWEWDVMAEDGYNQIIANAYKLFPKQSTELIVGLSKIIGKGSLLAYLVSMTLRIAEIYRVLKPTGTFYLHCDPTASHYLKILLDSIFCSRKGEYLNEFVWCYGERGIAKTYFNKKHDIIFIYSKTDSYTFNYKEVSQAYSDSTVKKFKHIDKATRKHFRLRGRNVAEAGALRRQTDIPLYLESEYTYRQYLEDSEGVMAYDWVEIDFLNQAAAERLGYDTQKPEALLEIFILASSNKGDTILDAYCGCGTTVAVSARLKRNWIGIDITYQSIALILGRLEDSESKKYVSEIELNGIPKDIDSAIALAHKKDDRVRKEFEKWAVLTYSNNKAMINEKKGADDGIDGIALMMEGHESFKDILFSVKSGSITLSMIRDFCHVVERDDAAIGVFITLEPPTKPMITEARKMGIYTNPLTEQTYDKIKIITIEKILEGEKLNVPSSIKILKTAEIKKNRNQTKLDF